MTIISLNVQIKQFPQIRSGVSIAEHLQIETLEACYNHTQADTTIPIHSYSDPTPRDNYNRVKLTKNHCAHKYARLPKIHCHKDSFCILFKTNDISSSLNRKTMNQSNKKNLLL